MLCILWCIPNHNCLADDTRIDLDYDIFLINDTVAVWLDHSPVLTQPLLEDLLAGLYVRIDVSYRVESPPNPVFTKGLAEAERSLFINRDLTRDEYYLVIVNGQVDSITFSTHLEMVDYLSDSMEVKLIPSEYLKKDEKIRIRFDVSSKSMSRNKLDSQSSRSGENTSEDEASADRVINSVFSYFVDFIGFGEHKYQVISPSFTISSLDSYPGQD